MRKFLEYVFTLFKVGKNNKSGWAPSFPPPYSYAAFSATADLLNWFFFNTRKTLIDILISKYRENQIHSIVFLLIKWPANIWCMLYHLRYQFFTFCKHLQIYLTIENYIYISHISMYHTYLYIKYLERNKMSDIMIIKSLLLITWIALTSIDFLFMFFGLELKEIWMRLE